MATKARVYVITHTSNGPEEEWESTETFATLKDAIAQFSIDFPHSGPKQITSIGTRNRDKITIQKGAMAKLVDIYKKLPWPDEYFVDTHSKPAIEFWDDNILASCPRCERKVNVGRGFTDELISRHWIINKPMNLHCTHCGSYVGEFFRSLLNKRARYWREMNEGSIHEDSKRQYILLHLEIDRWFRSRADTDELLQILQIRYGLLGGKWHQTYPNIIKFLGLDATAGATRQRVSATERKMRHPHVAGKSRLTASPLNPAMTETHQEALFQRDQEIKALKLQVAELSFELASVQKEPYIEQGIPVEIVDKLWGVALAVLQDSVSSRTWIKISHHVPQDPCDEHTTRLLELVCVTKEEMQSWPHYTPDTLKEIRSAFKKLFQITWWD